MKNKNLKIISIIWIILLLNFQNIQLANADFTSWLTEKISLIMEIRENEKINIWDFTKKIEKKIEKKSDELEKILNSKNAIEKIDSCDVLDEIIKKNKNNNHPILYRWWFWWWEVWIMDNNIIEENISFKSVPVQNSVSESWWNQDFSKTNVQVEWVDEWDIVKNNWRFIYILSNSSKSIRIFDTEKLKKFWEIKFPENFYGKEIFLSDDKIILIWTWYEKKITKSEKKDEKRWKIIWNNWKNFVKIFIYDQKNLELNKKFFFEWDFWKSRLIWENLFLITKKYSRNFWWWNKWEENIWEKNIPDFFDWEKFKKTAKCWEVEFFPWSQKTDFVTVSKINLNSLGIQHNKTVPGLVKSKIFLWDLEKIYMSKKNLFIATWVRWDDENFWNWNNTQIIKFWLKNLELKNIWKVKWRILNQFSMDEFDWNFRIMTTSNELETSLSDEKNIKNNPDIIRRPVSVIQNNLSILDENLKQIWEITWIAKWENIKSVRFMWNRAFIVTFKNMDPFFVLDLKDAKNPKILWELKIPGWSDYLHPFWENYILWFWKNAKEVKIWKNWEEENLRWDDVWWMKISLFDISDLKNPKEKFSWIDWNRWTYSDVLRNHHALFFDENNNRAVLWFHFLEKKEMQFEKKNCYEFNYSSCPVNVCQKRCMPSDWEFRKWDCDWPWSCMFKRYQNNIWTSFAWAEFLEVSKEKWFKELKRITNFSKEELQKQQYFWEKPGKKILRIIKVWWRYFWISEDSIIKVWKNFKTEKKFLIK